MENLIKANFKGPIYPVNQNRQKVFGIKTYPSVKDIVNEVELVVFSIPIENVPAILEECGSIGVKGAIILSAGGKEIGEKGKLIEDKIERIAKGYGIRIVGPNCVGVICPLNGLNASFNSHMPKPGKIAFISQSGALCAAILDLAMEENIAFSHFVSLGSMLDVDFGDLIDHLGNDPKVSSILIYMEGLTNVRKFMSAARSVACVKPIIVLKSGRSEAGAMAASSHTGSMTGEDILYNAAFDRAGVVRVKKISDLFACAELLSKQPLPNGPKLMVITNSGGPGVMAADAIIEQGLELAPLDNEILDLLNSFLPPYWNGLNPVDILGDATPERYVRAVKTCVKSKNVNGVITILVPVAMTNPSECAKALTTMLNQQDVPIISCWMGGRDVKEGRAILNNSDIPTFNTPEEAVGAFNYLYHYSKKLKNIQQIPRRFSRLVKPDKLKTENLINEGIEKYNGRLSEYYSMNVLKSYGFPVNDVKLAKSKEELYELARDMEPPFVLKIASPDILHKTEAGGVRLNLMTTDNLLKAFDEIMESAKEYKKNAHIEGVTIQSMIKNVDYEILAGAKFDKLFGPIVVFGGGGIFAEVLKDVSVGIPPLNRALAKHMIEKTKISRLLKGYRRRSPANFEDIEELLVRLGNLVIDFPPIQELDMNPIIIKEGRPVVVDARMILKRTDIKPPMHLIISPYPQEYEWQVTTSKDINIFVRPVRPEDAPLYMELFKQLSPTSVYYRFFRPLRELPHYLLVRFTQIDYDREIALVAIDKSSNEEKMLGVARIIAVPVKDKAEFAILVGDPWQGKGIGKVLLQKCLTIAKKQGIKVVCGTVLPSNRQMLALAEKLGFQIKKMLRGEYELTIDLEKINFEDINHN